MAKGGERGGVSPIPKGFYHKILIFFIKYRVFFRNFPPKRGGGLAQSKISLAEKIWASKLTGGGGGVSLVRRNSKKNLVFFFDASPNRCTDILSPCLNQRIFSISKAWIYFLQVGISCTRFSALVATDECFWIVCVQ